MRTRPGPNRPLRRVSVLRRSVVDVDRFRPKTSDSCQSFKVSEGREDEGGWILHATVFDFSTYTEVQPTAIPPMATFVEKDIAWVSRAYLY